MPRSERLRAVPMITSLLVLISVSFLQAAEPIPTTVPEPVAEAAAPQLAPDLSGTWTGRWQSCVNGHQGPIRATFCRIDHCHYRVTFHGRFLAVLPFHYAVTLRVTGVTDGQVTLGGSHRLGPLMGTFSFNATASCSSFNASYCSKDDQGWFKMTRCCP